MTLNSSQKKQFKALVRFGFGYIKVISDDEKVSRFGLAVRR